MKQLRWHMVVLSLVYVALGILLIAEPMQVMNIICYLVGGAVLLSGIVQLIRYFTQKASLFFAPLTLCFGILCVAIGGFLMLRSDIVMTLLPIVFGLFVIFDSVSRIQNALELHRCEYGNWWVFLLLGLLSIGLGVLMIANPFATIETLVMAIGVILCIEGALNLCSGLYTAMAVRSFMKKHLAVVSAVEAATGKDIDGDGVVAPPVEAATVEGFAAEVDGEPDTETVQEDGADGNDGDNGDDD